MNNKFDELAKGLAQSVTRRQAFKRSGVGLGGMALAALGVGTASAGSKIRGKCLVMSIDLGVAAFYGGVCVNPTTCEQGLDPSCFGGATHIDDTACGLVGDTHCSF